jgi:hypothetical protein
VDTIWSSENSTLALETPLVRWGAIADDSPAAYSQQEPCGKARAQARAQAPNHTRCNTNLNQNHHVDAFQSVSESESDRRFLEGITQKILAQTEPCGGYQPDVVRTPRVTLPLASAEVDAATKGGKEPSLGHRTEKKAAIAGPCHVMVYGFGSEKSCDIGGGESGESGDNERKWCENGALGCPAAVASSPKSPLAFSSCRIKKKKVSSGRSPHKSGFHATDSYLPQTSEVICNN